MGRRDSESTVRERSGTGDTLIDDSTDHTRWVTHFTVHGHVFMQTSIIISRI